MYASALTRLSGNAFAFCATSDVNFTMLTVISEE
jgi:hypothetical protein